MTTTAHSPANSHFPALSRILFLVATILLVIAALAGNNTLAGWSWLPWALGAFSAVTLAWTVA